MAMRRCNVPGVSGVRAPAGNVTRVGAAGGQLGWDPASRAGAARPGRSASKPNIIVILMDNLGCGELDIYVPRL
jgi:hypothetical protein